jgi:hypothetical protein
LNLDTYPLTLYFLCNILAFGASFEPRQVSKEAGFPASSAGQACWSLSRWKSGQE